MKPWAERIREVIPAWMQRSVGLRFMIALVLLVDVGIQALLEGLQSRWPGVGTPTALPHIGASRGLIRGMSETDDSFAARLIQWIDRWYVAATQRAMARAVAEYCTGTPKVKVVNRTGRMTTLDAGVFTVQDVTWNWDGTSHPTRAGYWAEIWILVYTPPWAIAGAWGTNTPTDCGIGQLVPRRDVDAIKSIVSSWKSAHTHVRAVLWAYDATLFNPAAPATMPNGTWGDWTYGGSLSGLGELCRTNKLRVWEPERDPNVGGPWA